MKPLRYINPFRNFRVRFPRWLFPKLGRLMLRAATRDARRALERSGPLKILVDNTILDVAITHESKWVTVKGGGYLARVPVHSLGNTTDRYRQATFLTGLTYLGRLGLIKFHQSAELDSEQFYQPMGRFRGYGWFDYSLFKGLEIESVDGRAFPTMGSKWMNLPSAQTQQRDRIRGSGDPLFEGLYKLFREQLGEKCSQDSWHVRTAEVHDCFCFLTTDRSLLKAWKSLRHKHPLKSMKTMVVSPADLADHLGILPVPPILLSYEHANSIVRVDTTMPDEKRRSRSRYRKP